MAVVSRDNAPYFKSPQKLRDVFGGGYVPKSGAENVIEIALSADGFHAFKMQGIKTRVLLELCVFCPSLLPIFHFSLDSFSLFL